MKNKIELSLNIADDGSVYYTAKFPDIDGCVGGGSTPTEAVREAKKNLKIYLDYQKEQENGKTTA